MPPADSAWLAYYGTGKINVGVANIRHRWVTIVTGETPHTQQ
jgi:hypothetical protein